MGLMNTSRCWEGSAPEMHMEAFHPVFLYFASDPFHLAVPEFHLL